MLWMTRLIGAGLFAALAMAGGSSAQTPPIFDMKGTWKGIGQAIIDGVTPLHPAEAGNAKPAATYRLREATYTYQINGQDGRRFWGTVSSDVAVNERLIGSLSFDGKTIYMAGKEGILDGVIIDANAIEMCYRHVNATSAIVNCNHLERQK